MTRDIRIRVARIEDAPLIARAEREIAKGPGLLVAQPGEISEEADNRVEKVEVLFRATNERAMNLYSSALDSMLR